MDWYPLWNSLRIALVSCAAVFFLGIFAAYYIAKLPRTVKGALDVVLTLPMVLPPTVVGYFLLLLFGAKRPLGAFFMEHFGVKLVMNWYSAIFASIVVAFPLMYRTARGAFESFDETLAWSAQTLGQSDVWIFWRVRMPCCRQGILAGTVLAFARALDLKESRVQFTPDVLPSDLVGFSVYQKETGKFVYHAGAVMCNLFLGDEINRTSSRTQSALLEVMEEGTVTVDGATRPVPAPFTVIATENPIGAAGTQMLPQSQLDRFMVCAVMGYPDEEAELAILAGQSKGRLLDRVRPVAGQADLLAMQQEVSTVFVHELMYRYIVALAQASRKDPRLAVGLSPRATLALASMTRAAAYLAGRDFVAPQDVTAVFDAVARHRLVLNDQARAGGETVDSVMQDLLRTVPRPRPEKADRHGR